MLEKKIRFIKDVHYMPNPFCQGFISKDTEATIIDCKELRFGTLVTILLHTKKQNDITVLWENEIIENSIFI